MTNPTIKFTVADYMSMPDGKRYQLLDGELVPAHSPTSKHQSISAQLYLTMTRFVTQSQLGRVWYAPLDVILSDHEVVQPSTTGITSEPFTAATACANTGWWTRKRMRSRFGPSLRRVRS